MAKSISYSERCYFTGRYLDGLYSWGPDHSLPRIGRGGWDTDMSVAGVVPDRRLNQDVEKRPGLQGNIVLSKKHREPSWDAGHHHIQDGDPRHPILGGSDCPDAPGTGHAQPGQEALAGFWPQLAAEKPLPVPLSSSTGCHCSEQMNERASLQRLAWSLELITWLRRGGMEAGGRASREDEREVPPQFSSSQTPQNLTLHPVLS